MPAGIRSNPARAGLRRRRTSSAIGRPGRGTASLRRARNHISKLSGQWTRGWALPDSCGQSCRQQRPRNYPQPKQRQRQPRTDHHQCQQLSQWWGGTSLPERWQPGLQHAGANVQSESQQQRTDRPELVGRVLFNFNQQFRKRLPSSGGISVSAGIGKRRCSRRESSPPPRSLPRRIPSTGSRSYDGVLAFSRTFAQRVLCAAAMRSRAAADSRLFMRLPEPGEVPELLAVTLLSAAITFSNCLSSPSAR